MSTTMQHKLKDLVTFLKNNKVSNFNIKKYKYDIDQVLGRFGLAKQTTNSFLQNLLNVSIDPTYVLPMPIEKQRQRLAWEGEVWNEEELKMHFLSMVFFFADFEVPDKIKLFYKRPLSAVVQATPLSVVCDALLATPLGINTPKTPYFFLQEFKKGKKAQDDAEGQMLVAILIAQETNQDGQPLYGCYLQGRFWYFATLHQKDYCLSSPYDAAQVADLVQIVHILQNIKNVIKL